MRERESERERETTRQLSPHPAPHSLPPGVASPSQRRLVPAARVPPSTAHVHLFRAAEHAPHGPCGPPPGSACFQPCSAVQAPPGARGREGRTRVCPSERGPRSSPPPPLCLSCPVGRKTAGEAPLTTTGVPPARGRCMLTALTLSHHLAGFPLSDVLRGGGRGWRPGRTAATPPTPVHMWRGSCRPPAPESASSASSRQAPRHIRHVVLLPWDVSDWGEIEARMGAQRGFYCCCLTQEEPGGMDGRSGPCRAWVAHAVRVFGRIDPRRRP